MVIKINKKLWGTKIWDNTGIYYYTEVNIKQGLTHTVPTETIEGYNRKYPFVIYNGIPSYYHGTASGNFSDNTSGECYEDYNFDGRFDSNGNIIYNIMYLNGFIKWLHNKKIKYLQYDEDMVIPVAILQDISWETEKSVADGENVTISFDWVQQGDEFSLTSRKYHTTCNMCGSLIAPSAVYCQKCGVKLS